MHSIADLIEQHRESVLKRFLDEASRLSSASGLPSQDILDNLPEYLDRLCALVREPHGHRVWLRQALRGLEEAHIGLRLRLGYDLEDVTAEFVLLGQLLTHLWESLPPEQRPSDEDTQILLTEVQSAREHTATVFRRHTPRGRRSRRPEGLLVGGRPPRAVRDSYLHGPPPSRSEAPHLREKRLRQALEASGLGTWELEPLTGTLYGDARCQAILGLPSRPSFRAGQVLARVHPEAREHVRHQVREALERRGLLRCEFRIDGGEADPERWVSATGRVSFSPGGQALRFVGTLMDISEQVNDRRSAERERHRATSILESISDAFVAFDPQWHFTYVNREAERLLGRSRDELLGRSHWEVFPSTLGTELEHHYRRAATERLPINFEIRSEHSGRWFEFHLCPTSQGLAIYFQDISERKVHELERERLLGEQTRLREQAEEALRFRERLLGIVSHDLRSPLQAISLAAGQVLRREDTPEPVLQGVRRIVRGAERMSRMIVDLLDFTRARLGGGIPLQRRPCELGTLVGTTLEEFEEPYPGRVVLVPGLSPCAGQWDPDRLAQVITNLVNNALHHGDERAPVRVALEEDAGGTRLTVHNLGPPIPEELLPHVFDPFRRASTRTHEGLGLGLYIVQQIVLAHGGHITVHSTGEAGTCFGVWLPSEARPH